MYTDCNQQRAVWKKANDPLFWVCGKIKEADGWVGSVALKPVPLVPAVYHVCYYYMSFSLHLSMRKWAVHCVLNRLFIPGKPWWGVPSSCDTPITSELTCETQVTSALSTVYSLCIPVVEIIEPSISFALSPFSCVWAVGAIANLILHLLLSCLCHSLSTKKKVGQDLSCISALLLGPNSPAVWLSDSDGVEGVMDSQ